MTATPTPGDLSARLQQTVRDLNEHRQTHVVWRDWLQKDPTNEQVNPHAGSAEFHAGVILDYDRHLANINEAIAALSALPAAGGAMDYTDIANRAQEITGRSVFPSTVEAVLKVAGVTTPQPSAAEGTFECANCECLFDGSAFASCPACGIGQDAAVGAQGDGVALMREASEVLAAVGTSGVALPENWRWPLVDELSGQAALLSAAPAAGKGVDDAMVDSVRADIMASAANEGRCDVVIKDEWVRAALEAALTRQPVAGDGWRPIESAPENVEVWLFDPDTDPQQYAAVLTERDPDIGGLYWRPKESLVAEMLDYELTPTHWMPLPAAPASTPTDGGEG